MLVAIVLIVSNCSKSSGNHPTPLTNGDWKLLRSDTTLYDSAYHVTGLHSADVSGCDHQRHLILLQNGNFEGYAGCAKPSNLQPAGTWTNDNPYLIMYLSSDPRSGPIIVGTDSIEVCNWDSLVLFQRVSPHEPSSGVYSLIPETIQSWWGH